MEQTAGLRCDPIREFDFAAWRQRHASRQTEYGPIARMQIVHIDREWSPATVTQAQRHRTLDTDGNDFRQLAGDARRRQCAYTQRVTASQSTQGLRMPLQTTSSGTISNAQSAPSTAQPAASRSPVRSSVSNASLGASRSCCDFHLRGASTLSSSASSTSSTRRPSICISGARLRRWRSAGFARDRTHVVGCDEIASVEHGLGPRSTHEGETSARAPHPWRCLATRAWRA